MITSREEACAVKTRTLVSLEELICKITYLLTIFRTCLDYFQKPRRPQIYQNIAGSGKDL